MATAAQGDVLIGTLEYSQIEEQLITFRQQQVSTIAEINRLLGRPASTPIHGPDQFGVTLPLWERKYDAIEQEASWKHAATRASVDDSRQRYDALLLDLWEKAKAADETVQLYKTTILPQAEETRAADQLSYSTSSVEFDRVIRDFRNLLTLELGYHRAVGQLATALARIRQATGIELSSESNGRLRGIEPGRFQIRSVTLGPILVDDFQSPLIAPVLNDESGR